MWELTDTCVTLRLNGFPSRVLRFEDIDEADVVPSELDRAIGAVDDAWCTIRPHAELDRVIALLIKAHCNE